MPEGQEAAALGVGAGSREDASDQYRAAAGCLLDAGVPFLVGGGYALGYYTPVLRNAKDLDLFVRPEHAAWALRELEARGFRTALPFPHWLGKAYRDGWFVDVIFCSGNGVAVVDEEWFASAIPADILGYSLPLCPPEEMIWSKAFVCERERFDGADVMHLVRDCGPRLDWDRLLRRFGPHWRVLYAHLILFGFVYPSEASSVPSWVMKELGERLARERDAPSGPPDVCRGTLLSREQYLVDVEHLGYLDARLRNPDVRMTAEDVALWTRAIPGRSRP